MKHHIASAAALDGRGNGNDPDGWTAQMILTVTRR